MKFVVMAVRDIKAGVFGNPFFMTSVGQAERQFADEVNRAAEDNVMYKHPEDFELFELGSFDTSVATFELFDRPVQRGVGSSMVRPDNVRKLREPA